MRVRVWWPWWGTVQSFSFATIGEIISQFLAECSLTKGLLVHGYHRIERAILYVCNLAEKRGFDSKLKGPGKPENPQHLAVHELPFSSMVDLGDILIGLNNESYASTDEKNFVLAVARHLQRWVQNHHADQ